MWSYLNRAEGDSNEIAGELLRLAWSSVAALAIAPLQDLLNLGAEARMNLPGSTDAHWRWRCTEEMLQQSDFPPTSGCDGNFKSLACAPAASQSRMRLALQRDLRFSNFSLTLRR